MLCGSIIDSVSVIGIERMVVRRSGRLVGTELDDQVVVKLR
jgi:hypothetical protein